MGRFDDYELIYVFRKKKDDGGGCFEAIVATAIIALAIVLIMLVSFLFTYPYHIIDREFSVLKFKWFTKIDIWVFCLSFWINFILTIYFLFKVIKNKYKKINNSVVDNVYKYFVTLSLYLFSSSMILMYLLNKYLRDFTVLTFIVFAAIGFYINHMLSKNMDKNRKVFQLILSVIIPLLSFLMLYNHCPYTIK